MNINDLFANLIAANKEFVEMGVFKHPPVDTLNLDELRYLEKTLKTIGMENDDVIAERKKRFPDSEKAIDECETEIQAHVTSVTKENK